MLIDGYIRTSILANHILSLCLPAMNIGEILNQYSNHTMIVIIMLNILVGGIHFERDLTTVLITSRVSQHWIDQRYVVTDLQVIGDLPCFLWTTDRLSSTYDEQMNEHQRQ